MLWALFGTADGEVTGTTSRRSGAFLTVSPRHSAARLVGCTALDLRSVLSRSLTIDFEWDAHGAVTADGHTIRFEPAPRVPGLYRIDLDSNHTYIGEARSLARRFYGYRHPGGSVETLVPRTNRRVQRQILETLAAGRTVAVWICTAATVSAAGESNLLPLNDKTHRLLVEAAAMILAERDGWTLENLHRA